MSISPSDTAKATAHLLSELAAAADQTQDPAAVDDADRLHPAEPGQKILHQARQLARTYLTLSAQALPEQNPENPLNHEWAHQTGAFLTQAFDLLYSAVAAERYLAAGQVPEHPQLRILTMQELVAIERAVSDDLCWPLYADKILAGYRDLPRF